MPPKKTINPKDQLRAKIASIRKAILKAETMLKESKNLDKDIDKSKSVLLESINELRNMASQHPDAAANISIEDEINRLEQEVEFPNLHQPYLHPEQEKARAAAAQVLTNWERVTPGVSLNDLSDEDKGLLQACTMESWSPLQSALNAMINKREGVKENAKVITARLNFAIALFQAMVPQFCGMNIPTRTHFEQNENVRNLLECIAIVACNKSEEDYNPIFVFAEAAFKNPLQFLKDAAGVSFAFGALTEMAGSTVVGLVQQVPQALFSVGKYMVTNPLASFTTYHVAESYIKGLLQQVFGERFGRQYQGDQRIVELFNELSDFYLRQGVTDIIGFPPADVDSVRNKLSQILYNIGYRSVSSMQRTGDILSQALQFPGELCKSMMGAGSAIKRWLCSNGMRLLGRYNFIPQGTDEGLFESILACLDEHRLLDNPDIDAFVIAYLKHNQPTTVFRQSVEYHNATDVLQHGPLLSAGQMSESLNVDIDPNSQQQEMEEVGVRGGSDLLADPGNISAEPNMSSSNGGELETFRVGMQPEILQAHDVQIAARQKEEAAAAPFPPASAVPPFAQGGNPGSFFPSGTGANLSPAFDSRRGGGRSRSRKRSVSKRTRRKGVAKKQKSKKNKRQSRRKVRRASSRKGRK